MALRWQIIPHGVTVPGVAAGLGFAACFQHVIPLNAVVGCIAGLSTCLLANRLSERRVAHPGAVAHLLVLF